MKTISRKDLIKMSVAIFAAHSVNTLFATSDGQFFIVQDRAKLHARSAAAKLTIYEIERHEAEGNQGTAKQPDPAPETKNLPTSEKVKQLPVEAENVDPAPADKEPEPAKKQKPKKKTTKTKK